MGVPVTTRRRATYEELCQVPDHKVAEILDGELIVTPRPALRHASASSGLGGLLWGPFQGGRSGPGGWWILDEPELHLADDILVPDLAGWRRERVPSIPDTAYMTLAPDWVCEVISPATERMDRSRKIRIYAREAFRTSGCSTRSSEPSRCFGWKAPDGCSWTRTVMPMSSVSSPSRPSRSS